jgi:hypothetical protein
MFGQLNEKDVRKIVRQENNLLADQIVDIINMALLCIPNSSGQVVSRTAEEEREIAKRR